MKPYHVAAVAVLSAVMFIGGALAATAASMAFRDVPTNYWAYDAIKWASDKGLFVSLDSSKVDVFEPESTVTKAQLAYAVYKATADLSDRLSLFERVAGIRNPDGTVNAQIEEELKAQAARQAEATKYQQDLKNNPQLAYDAQRRSDISTILNAIYQYEIDNNGRTPAVLSAQEKEVCSNKGASCKGMVDLKILTGTYLVNIPRDPSLKDTSSSTGYVVSKDKSGRITVRSKKSESGQAITVTR